MDDASRAAAVQPSQGVHLVFSRDFLQGDSAIMVPHTDDGRVLFVIPWHGHVLVGTTDTAMPTKPTSSPRALDEEIGFILRNAARYLARDPEPRRHPQHLRRTAPRSFARPSKGGGATKGISRNHEVIVSDAGLVTIVGGKWTTYRKMAEDTLDHAVQIGGLDDKPCVTESLQLHGWRSPNSPALEDYMKVYGSDAPKLEHLMDENPEYRNSSTRTSPIPKPPSSGPSANEWARSVEDILSRRTRALLLDAKAAIESARTVAELLAKELGKDEAWIAKQVEEFNHLALGYCGK